MTAGSPPNSRCHMLQLSAITPGAPGAASSSTSARPSTGETPSVWKNPGPTMPARRARGSSVPVHVTSKFDCAK